MVVKYRKSIGGYILDSVFGVNKPKNIIQEVPTLTNNPTNCSWCGSSLKVWANCQGKLHWLGKGFILCEKCAKKCSKCGRYFYPKHINNHKCK